MYQDHSLIVIIWLTSSVSLCPKVITLNRFHRNIMFTKYVEGNWPKVIKLSRFHRNTMFTKYVEGKFDFPFPFKNTWTCTKNETYLKRLFIFLFESQPDCNVSRTAAFRAWSGPDVSGWSRLRTVRRNGWTGRAPSRPPGSWARPSSASGSRWRGRCWSSQLCDEICNKQLEKKT